MKTCPVCGQPMEDFEIFCGSCGAKYEAPAEAPVAGTDPAPVTEAAPVAEPVVMAEPVVAESVAEPVPVEASGVVDAAPAASPAFCPNCGEQLAPGAVFCPNCGSNLQTGEGPAVQPRKFAVSPKVLGIVGACAAVALVVVGVVKLVQWATTSPADRFISYQEEALDQVEEQLRGFTDAYTDGFSTDMTLTVDVSGRGMGMMSFVMDALEDSSIGLKLDANSKSVLANADVTLMGSKVLEGAVMLSDKTLSFNIPQVDSNCYEVDLEAVMKQAMGETGVDTSTLFTTGRLVSEDTLHDLADRYIDIVEGVFTKESVTKSSKNTVRLSQLGERMDGTLYIFKPQSKDVEKVLEKLADAMEKDDKLRDTAIKLMEAYRPTMGYYYRDMDMADAYDDAIYELVENIRDNAADIADQIEDMGIVWTVGVSKGKLVLDTIQVGDTVIGYENSGEEMIFYVKEGEWSYNGVRVVTEKDGKLLSGYVSAEGNYGSTRFLDFEQVDTSTRSALGVPYGEYTLTMDGESVGVEVTKGAKGGTDHIVTVPVDTGYGTAKVQVTLNTTDKKSTAKKPSGKKVSIDDVYELQDVIEDVSDELEYVIGDVANALF